MLPYITAFGAFLSEVTNIVRKLLLFTILKFKKFFSSRVCLLQSIHTCMCMYVCMNTHWEKRISQSKGNNISLFFEIRLQNLNYMICFLYTMMLMLPITLEKVLIHKFFKISKILFFSFSLTTFSNFSPMACCLIFFNLKNIYK